MNFTLNRTRTIVGTCGRSVTLVKGVATYVPPSLHQLVIAAGGLPDEDIQDPQVLKTHEPDDPIARKKIIMDAFRQMVLADIREEFTAAGAPHAKSLIKYVGFSIDRKERDELWVEFQQGKDKDE